jgi:hypothetical protein
VTAGETGDQKQDDVMAATVRRAIRELLGIAADRSARVDAA